ncbi:hypothetical protein BC827DRAFT_1152463 [Russula dissimulans]|nr:hypothetical protein BC827DRAFT_1152463 [Russula dissimulans]
MSMALGTRQDKRVSVASFRMHGLGNKSLHGTDKGWPLTLQNDGFSSRDDRNCEVRRKFRATSVLSSTRQRDGGPQRSRPVPLESPCRELTLRVGSGDSNGDPTWTERICGVRAESDKVGENQILLLDYALFFGIGRIGAIKDNVFIHPMFGSVHNEAEPSSFSIVGTVLSTFGGATPNNWRTV